MKILDRYIGFVIAAAILLVLLVLVGLQIFIGFVAELNSIGSGHYGVIQALLYVIMSLPKNIYSFFPMVGLLGSLLGLGYLASHSELIVMRASGVSLGRISWALLKAAILVLILMTVLGEVVAPYANRTASIDKAIAKDGEHPSKVIKGVWLRKHDDYIYIDRIEPHKQLVGVSQFQFDPQHRLVLASYASHGNFVDGHWQLHNIQQTRFVKQQVKTNQQATLNWDVALNPKLLPVTADNPNDMSLVGLMKLIHFQHKHGLGAGSYELVFWQRVFQPLATIVMILLAIPFIFGPLRSAAMGSRILIGAVVGFVFYLLNQFFGPVSVVYQIPPIFGALIPILFFCFIAVLLLRRVG